MASRRPRVLVLASTFPRWMGDSEPRFILDFCRHLSEHAEILVLCPHVAGAHRSETIEGVRVHRFRYFIPHWQALTGPGGMMQRMRANRWRLLQLPFFVIAYAFSLRLLIRRWQPDVVHAHWILPQGFVAWLALPSALPLICTSHGGDLHGLQGRLPRIIKNRVLSRCVAVTVVSRSMVSKIREFSPSVSVHVMPMGTDMCGLFVPPASDDHRDTRHVLFAGRLVEKKGVAHLLDAVKVLLEQDTEVRLTIAGDGPLAPSLKARAQQLGIDDSVFFAGSMDQQSLATLYRKATIAVFPFVVAADGDQEGFGLVVAEAAACGCPVIASDLPAIRDTLVDGHSGILVEPGNSSALAHAIGVMLTDDCLRSRYAREARASLFDRLDWRVIAARYGDLYREICKLPMIASIPGN